MVTSKYVRSVGGNLCLANFYSVEILESLGIIDPHQSLIDEIEHILLAQSPSNQMLLPLKEQRRHNTVKPSKVLLVENIPLIAACHSVLLSNADFDVEVVASAHEATSKQLNEYVAIFLRDSSAEKNSFWLMRFIQETLSIDDRPTIFNFCSKSQMSHENKITLKASGSNEILRFPLMFSDLVQKIKRSGLCIENFNKASCQKTSHMPIWIEIIHDLSDILGYSYSRIAYRIGSSPSSIQKLMKDSTRTPRDKMFLNLCQYYYKLFYGVTRSKKAAEYVEANNHQTFNTLLNELFYRGYFDKIEEQNNPHGLLKTPIGCIENNFILQKKIFFTNIFQHRCYAN